MPDRVRKAPASRDPRTWLWTGDGFRDEGQAPYNYLVRSPGAFDWCAPLATGMVLHHSIISVRNRREWYWQVDTVFDTRTYRMLIESIDTAVPGGSTPTLKVEFYCQQFFGDQVYHAREFYSSPLPIVPFVLSIFTPPPPTSPFNVLPSGIIIITPVIWDTPETPGGD